MYKCGWQGCEKAYGTLNHLNAHVTMQSHGQKRTPEGEDLLSSFSFPFFVPFDVSRWMDTHLETNSRCGSNKAWGEGGCAPMYVDLVLTPAVWTWPHVTGTST